MLTVRCGVKHGDVNEHVCWMTRMALAKAGDAMTACAACEGRLAVDGRKELKGESRACPAMLAPVPVQECGKKLFGKCETCPPVKAAEKKEEKPQMKTTGEKCACGAPATVGRYGPYPPQCEGCRMTARKAARDGNTPQIRPSAPVLAKPAPAPMAPKAVVPLPRTTAAEANARSVTQQMMDISGQFLVVITHEGFPLDAKVDILSGLAEGVKNMSRVALIMAEQSIK